MSKSQGKKNLLCGVDNNRITLTVGPSSDTWLYFTFPLNSFRSPKSKVQTESKTEQENLRLKLSKIQNSVPASEGRSGYSRLVIKIMFVHFLFVFEIYEVKPFVGISLVYVVVVL